MLSGKNKQRFEAWYRENIRYKEKQELCVNAFYDLCLELQKGVYEKYFDSLGYSIEIMTTRNRKTEIISYEVDIYDNYMAQIEVLYIKYKTRLEAFKEAVKQLDKLINEEL